MKVVRCILLFLQVFLHLSTYTNLPHLLSLHQSFSCFLQLIPFISSLIGSVYIFHPLHVSLLHQNIFLRSSQIMTIPPHTICPCQFICCFFQSQHVHQLHCIPLVHQLYTAHCPRHKSFCSSQNSYFIFSQTTHLTSI